MTDPLKTKIDNILAENKDLPLEQKANRDLLSQLILAAVQGKSQKPTATVLTPEASAYDPKKDGPRGPKPQSL
jgi:regulator of replication initiation timing